MAFIDDLYNRLYQSEQRQRDVLGIFSGLAILIALLGIFGMISFMIQKRTKELAIRKVLGASQISIVGLFGKNFVTPILIAVIVASFAARSRWSF